jgi:D-sedoheptulose 7-phosphate isomerase
MGRCYQEIFKRLIHDNPELEICSKDIEQAFLIIEECYINGGKVMVCGNGGSAADSEHIVGELMKGFLLKRELRESDKEKLKINFPNDWQYLANNLQYALPAISLVSQTALLSAISNDINPDMIYAQQIFGYKKNGDILIGISTSGNSQNVINAVKVAKAFNLKTIALTGENGGEVGNISDIVIKAPASRTYKIQEYHLSIYHALCSMIEFDLFKD